jgi:hypothetical protein
MTISQCGRCDRQQWRYMHALNLRGVRAERWEVALLAALAHSSVVHNSSCNSSYWLQYKWYLSMKEK